MSIDRVACGAKRLAWGWERGLVSHPTTRTRTHTHSASWMRSFVALALLLLLLGSTQATHSTPPCQSTRRPSIRPNRSIDRTLFSTKHAAIHPPSGHVAVRVGQQQGQGQVARGGEPPAPRESPAAAPAHATRRRPGIGLWLALALASGGGPDGFLRREDAKDSERVMRGCVVAWGSLCVGWPLIGRRRAFGVALGLWGLGLDRRCRPPESDVTRRREHEHTPPACCCFSVCLCVP